MSRFDVEVTLCREVCMLGLVALPLVREALLPASCSRSLSLSLPRWGSLSALPSLPSFFCMAAAALYCAVWSWIVLRSANVQGSSVPLLSGCPASVLIVVGAKQRQLLRPHHTRTHTQSKTLGRFSFRRQVNSLPVRSLKSAWYLESLWHKQQSSCLEGSCGDGYLEDYGDDDAQEEGNNTTEAHIDTLAHRGE